MAAKRKKVDGSRAGVLVRVPRALYEAIKDLAVVERRSKFAETCIVIEAGLAALTRKSKKA